jgi:5'-nucleotidase
MKRYTVAVDIDGVIGDWETMNNRSLRSVNVDHPMIMEVRDDYGLMVGDEVLDAQMREAMDISGSYLELDVIPGAREALEEMVESGLEVFLLSTPHLTNRTCASDKFNWIEDRFGEFFMKRTNLTLDKTLFRADLLIDDKPTVTGAMKPVWQHVLFDQPYNQHIKDKNRIYGWGPGVVPALHNLLEQPRRRLAVPIKKALVNA